MKILRLILSICFLLLFFSSPASAFETESSLANAPISYLDANNYKYTGWSVSAGDVDGDGIQDLLIGGSPVYLILGKNIGSTTGTTIEDYADASFLAENSGDDFGNSVTMAGDINNDGFDDILIGAQRYNSSTGKTYLIMGKATGWSKNSAVTDIAAATFTGVYESDWSGYSVTIIGDINNDQYDDFLIGAYMVDVGSMINAGRTYLFLGNSSGFSGDLTVADADVLFNGEHIYDGSGRKTAAAGDVNNDGYDDFLISAPGDETYLLLGRASGWSGEISLGLAEASFVGESAGDFAGWAINSAGDVNGDGFDDILIGAEDNDTNATNAGKVYLIFGKETGWSQNISLSLADASFYGEVSEDNLGKSVSSAGDVNNDGYADMLMGASSANQWTGKAYLVLGKEDGWAANTPIDTAEASYLGEATYDYAGFQVAAAGDINGDGSSEFLISAAYFGSQYTGKVYFYYGEGPVKGDLNADDSVDLTDAIIALKVISGQQEECAHQFGNDVNSDLLIGLEEVLFALQKAADF